MNHPLRSVVTAACLVAAATFTATAQVDLTPGSSVVPPAANLPAVIILDEVIPFDIRSGTGALLYRANFRNRVTRDGAGKLIFYSYVRDTQPGLNGIINKFERINFAGRSTKLFFDPTGGGTVAPSLASRSGAPGGLISLLYNPGIFSNVVNRPVGILTDATSFNNNGLTVIRLTSGESVALATAQPGNSIPTAIITGPSPFSCACSPINITGTATASGGFLGYTVEYSASPAGPWNTIVTSPAPVVSGTLAVWDTSAIVSGDYFVRLRVANSDGSTDSFVTMMRVDSSAPTADLRAPVNGGIYGGVVCFDGTAIDNACFDSYALGYRKVGQPSFITFATSTAPVINDPLGAANLGAVADGPYEVRFRVLDSCGRDSTVTRTVQIDNTAPVARITDPINCQSSPLNSLVPIVGTAFDNNISSWTVSIVGGPYNSFVTIASGTGNIVNSLLAQWDTTGLPACCYTIRLAVSDRASVNCSTGHYSEFLTSIDLGGYDCRTDFNDDGGIDGSDVDAFFEAWSAAECD